MATIYKATAARFDFAGLCLLLTTYRGIGHDLSATASINQPRRLRFVAYVMDGLVIFLYGFGYVNQ